MFLANTLMFLSPLIDCQWLCFIQGHLSNSWSQTVFQCCISMTVLANALRKRAAVSEKLCVWQYLCSGPIIPWPYSQFSWLNQPWTVSFTLEQMEMSQGAKQHWVVCTSCWNSFGWHPLYISLPPPPFIRHPCTCHWLQAVEFALTPWPTDGTPCSL